jgi:hypothetical protein
VGESDPIKSGAGICWFVGAMNLLAAALLVALDLSHGLGGLIVCEALLYVALGFGILRESRLCAFAAAGLYTVSTMSLLGEGFPPSALLLRGVLAYQLWRAALRILDLRALDRVADERRRAIAEGRTSFLARREPIALTPPPAVTGPRPSARPSARLRDVGTLMIERRRHCRVCARCDREYPLRTLRCERCRVQLFDA